MPKWSLNLESESIKARQCLAGGREEGYPAIPFGSLCVMNMKKYVWGIRFSAPDKAMIVSQPKPNLN